MKVILISVIAIASIAIAIFAGKISECEEALDDNFQNKNFAEFIKTLGETTKKKN